MWRSNPEESLNRDARPSDGDEDEDNNWDEELLCAVRLKVAKLGEDPEQSRLFQIDHHLNKGANIDVQDRNGDTVLHMAVRKGFRQIVKFLRQRGAQTNIPNYNGETAIGLSETLQKKDIVSMLRKPVEQRNEPAYIRTSEANNTRSAAKKAQPSSSRGCDHATQQEPTTVGDDSKRTRPRKQLHPPEHADNAKKYPDSEEQKTYDAGATLRRSWPGIVYQLKHLAFTLYCALQQGDPHFLLATEMVAAGKLDDVVLQYKNDNGKQVGRFVQIKYTSNQRRRISAKELLDAGGAFSVPTYFTSWRKLKKEELFREIDVRNMMLCTNEGLDVEDLAENGIGYQKTEDPDKSFELRSDQKQTACYKLSPDRESNEKLYSELKAASDFSRLAKLVAKCIYNKNAMRWEMANVKEYHLALAKYVFDVEAKKFHDNFIHNSSLAKNVEEFREIFLTEFRNMARSLNTDSSDEATWKEIQTKFQKPVFPKGFGEAPEGTTNKPAKYYSELPDDYVDDVEISNFLEEFTLAVDQPNEDEFNKILREKIDADSGFNLKNTELLDGAFQKNMLDCFVKNNEGTEEKEYFSYKVSETFFRVMKNEVGSLITIGVNSLYCEQMKEYDVHFKSEMQQVKAFLTQDVSHSTANRILELVAPGETLLTALRVHDTLGRIQKYNKMDSFIFTRVDSLKHLSILNFIKNTFDSLRYPDLLIVDCGLNGTDQCLQTLWNSLFQIIDKKENKKMIVITRAGEDLGTQFEYKHEIYDKIEIDLGFRDLTNATQKKLLEKPVTKFQGHQNKTSLGKLLDIQKFDNLSADELQDLSEIIDANALVEIIRSDQLKFGDNLDGMDTPKHCYINRTICRDVVIKKAMLKDEKIPDLIAISGINAVLQGTSLKVGESFAIRQHFSTDLFAEIGIDEDPSGKLMKIGKSPPKAHHLTNFTILDNTRAEEQFNDLCAKNRGRNVHWLQKEQERYIWKKTQGDIAYLVQHRDASGTDDCNDGTGVTRLSKDQLILHDEPVIISDTAGMGKSTMLTYLAGEIKKNEPDMLVLKIDLNRHATALAKVSKKSTYDLGITNKAIEFLVEKLLSEKNDLSKKIYRRIIERKHKVALIFDGFDEISPNYEAPVINLLRTLADYGIKKLLVATRPHTRATLETELKTFSYVIQPFSTNDQERFLTEFWKAKCQDLHCDSQQTAEDRMKKYTGALMMKLADLIKDPKNKFTGFPLQAKLVAEIFENSCKEFANSKVDEPKFPEEITLIYLYENFVDKKFDVFFRKRGGNFDDVAVIEDRSKRYKSFMNVHETLALHTLLGKDKMTELLHTLGDANRRSPEPADLDSVVERDGIITQFIDDQYVFGHCTHAEYFAAKFLSDTLKNGQQTEPLGNIFVKDILLGENYKTTRAFIDGLLSDKHVLRGEFWGPCSQEHRSQQQETIFHVAAAEGNDSIMRLFLDHLHTNTGDQENLINERDIFGCMAIHRAVQSNIDIIKYLIHEGADINCQSNDGLTPLHLAAQEGKLDVVEYLLKHGAKIDCQLNDGETPLHLAAGEGKLDVVEYLLKHGAKIDCQLNDGETPLYLAASQGQMDVVEYLLKHGAKIDVKSNNGGTPLHLAAQEGKLDVVEYLLKHGAKIDCQLNDGETPLHLAAGEGKLDVVEYLLKHGAKIDCQEKTELTPLHLAAGQAKLDVVEYLLKHGAKIDCQEKRGWTPLHLAAGQAKLDVVEYLLKHGAKIDCQLNDGETPLHLAALQGQMDVVEYLLEHGAKIDCQQKNGLTPLHRAAIRGELDVVEYLLKHGAKIDCQLNDGETPLHLAASQGQMDVVEYLLEHGAKIDCQQKDGLTPLHRAAIGGKLDVVEYLLKHGAKIDCRDKNGLTPLHLAAGKGKLDVVEYLLKHGAKIDCRDKNGLTPLHLAAGEGKLDVVEYLLKHGAKIDCQLNDGETPLHLAASQGQMDVVEYLLEHEAKIDVQSNDGGTPLHLAAGKGKLDVVEYLLKHGAKIDVQSNDGGTPLHLTAQEGKLDVVEYLLKHGAKIDCRDKNGLTPLHLAAGESKLDVVEYLLKHGAKIDCQLNDGETPLHLAALQGQMDVVEYLLEHGAKIDCQQKNGLTPLHRAAIRGKLDVVEYLLKHGAKIDCRDKNGLTPLHLAAGESKLDVVEYLLKHGAKIDCQLNDGETLLHLAASQGQMDVVEYLLKHGAKIDCRDKNGLTPLHLAAGKGKLDVVEYLLKHGAKIDCRDKNGLTPLHLAAGESKLDVVEYLLKHGAKIDCQLNDGETPLHLAALQGQMDVVEYLLEHGAKIDCQQKNGLTPLHRAAIRGKLDVVEYLLKHGAKIDCRDKNGLTPLHLAAGESKLDVVEYLLKHGAKIDCQLNDGETLLHLAASQGQMDVVEYLLKHGAKIDCRDKNGLTPLHLAAGKGKLDVVEYLLKHGAKIDCRQKSGLTPLHLAALQRKLDVVEYLLKHGARIEC